jgi:uncharacterized protein
LRVIVDANVAIAGVVSLGLCEALMELCLENHQPVLCEGILDEIREKLASKIKVPAPLIAEYLKVLRSYAEIVEPEEVQEGVCRDPDDLMVLGLVVPGNADVIVTGDNDLLVIKEYRKAQILSPRGFWELNKRGE